MENKPRHRTLHWFRKGEFKKNQFYVTNTIKKGLRIHDNEALQHAIKTSEVLYCVYILGKKTNSKLKRLISYGQ